SCLKTVSQETYDTRQLPKHLKTCPFRGPFGCGARMLPVSPPEPSSSRRIRWSEDVVDNEGMGKKSSKVCCIYHKARPVGESSSESESSSSSDSDSESETDCRGTRPNHHHSHPQGRGPAGEGSSDQPQAQASDACTQNQHRHRQSKPKRKPSPNAYEKMPRSSKNPSRGT
ncbi:Type 1 phosphatases regulator ypi1, partial [Penicillium frequentans]